MLSLVLAALATPLAVGATPEQVAEPDAAALQRTLPHGPELETGIVTLRGLAREAGLDEVALRPEPAIENDDDAFVPVEVSARADYAAVVAFVRYLARLPRAVSIDRIALAWAEPGRLRFAGTVSLKYLPRDADPSPARTEAVRAARAWLQRRDHELAHLLPALEDAPVALDEVVLGEEFHVRGVRMLPSPDIRQPLEAAGAEVTHFAADRDAACESFVVRGRTSAGGADPDRYPDLTHLFEPAGALCRVDRDGGEVVPVASAAGHAPGPLTLRARDLDLVDAFFALHELTGEGFAVEEDVRGRVSVELQGMSLDDVLAAIQASAGVHVGPPGFLRRVSRAPIGAASPEGQDPAGFPVNLSFRRHDVRSLVRLFAEVSGLSIDAPPGELGRVSVMGVEVPWDDAFVAILGAAGLDSRVDVDEGRVTLTRAERRAQRAEPPLSEAPALSPARALARARAWSGAGADDVELVGLAAQEDTWRAGLRIATGQVSWVGAGHALQDAVLESVDANGVWLRPTDGRPPRRLTLPAPR